MFYIGIYDNQVIRTDREKCISNAELSVIRSYIKKFCTLMCMECTMPISFIFCCGSIYQFEKIKRDIFC